MKAYRMTSPGIDQLRLVEMETPEAGHGEVLVRLHAAALNFIDLVAARNDYPGLSWPLLPGTDGAGTVVATGPAVTAWTAGDRVMPPFKPAWVNGPISPTSNTQMRGMTVPGTLAEYAVVPADALVRTPDHLTDVEAATLPIAATTAWNAIRSAAIGPASTVLLLGTGGVSMFALQFAKAAGARVLITSSSDEKLERARALGADEGINYRRTEAWDAEAIRLTDGRGVDLVLESGGTATIARSLAAAAYGGVVFTIGFVSGSAMAFDAMPLIGKALRIQGNNTGSVADLAMAARAVAAHRITPVVDRVFDWRDARQAYEALASASHVGKIALTIA